MPSDVSPTALDPLRKFLSQQTHGALSDQELLHRFVQTRDEEAFAALVRRHGPMVMSTCQRVLQQRQDAEDVYQAVFLILARKAPSLHCDRTLASWLYVVAQRLAARLRQGSAKRRIREANSTAQVPEDGVDEVLLCEARCVLDDELARLPRKLQMPILLCCLQGQTGEEAAEQIGCSLATLKRMLKRGREALKKRLEKRGMVLSTGLFGVLLSEGVVPATLPAQLPGTTVQASLLYAAGKSVAGTVSSQTLTLADGAIRAMFMTKMKVMGTLFVVLSLAGGGLSMVAAGPEQDPAKLKKTHAATTKVDGTDHTSALQIASPREGILLFVGSEFGNDEKVPPSNQFTLQIGQKPLKLKRIRVGDRVAVGQLIARLDNRLALIDLSIKEETVKAANAEVAASLETLQEATARADTVKKVLERGQTTQDDLGSAQRTMLRYKFELTPKVHAQLIAGLEVEKARTVLSTYDVRSPVAGTITAIYKRAGEAARAFETLFEIAPDPEP